ncbi:beta-glucanase [Winogradskyella sp. PC-19]|uniref:family 16 glycosylhydrolase n=1 Tax=unclassified Winogradskyella TaxID=2615021 RepID=UPI000B3C4223|nr:MULTISPECIES: family 16 glycosylhydrolase [unclassified Winogradskyella]ARV08385.1 beta-glucanase [Winogradskyella sp. PC-19]
MNCKLFFTRLFCFFTLYITSQQIPLDFSSTDDTFIGFAGSGFSFRTVSPSTSSNPGGQFFNDGSQPFQGFYIDLVQPIVLDSDNKLFSLEFYSFDPNNHNIILKLEDSNNTDVEVITEFSVPSPSDWTTVIFDFSNAIETSTGNPINATGSYSRVTIFIDGGTNVSGTYIIDDITNGDVTPPVNPNTIDIIYDNLVWSDEFDGLVSNSTKEAINSINWHHQTQLPFGGSWYNNEVQHYTNRIENSFVENGNLNISAIFEGRISDGQGYTDQGETKEYTSARLNSKFAFKYGRVDVRAKLPFGDGTWPAIWMLGKNINEDGAWWDLQGFGDTNWPDCGEIDIMEHGLHSLNEVSVALHTPSSFGATINSETKLLPDVANNFHLYSMNWSPDKIVFLIDDIPFYTYNPTIKNASTWPFDEEQYIILNIAMGGAGGPIDPNFANSEMVIDYVRVYQSSALDVEENDLTNQFKIYPNPSNAIIFVDSQLSIDSLKLYNALGQMVIEKFGEKRINVSNLPQGIYVLKIISENATITKRVVVN